MPPRIASRALRASRPRVATPRLLSRYDAWARAEAAARHDGDDAAVNDALRDDDVLLEVRVCARARA